MNILSRRQPWNLRSKMRTFIFPRGSPWAFDLHRAQAKMSDFHTRHPKILKMWHAITNFSAEATSAERVTDTMKISEHCHVHQRISPFSFLLAPSSGQSWYFLLQECLRITEVYLHLFSHPTVRCVKKIQPYGSIVVITNVYSWCIKSSMMHIKPWIICELQIEAQ